jgi:UDP-N-acetylmuramate--alanine ligase
MQEFAGAFADASQVIVTEVYAAREKAIDFDNFSALQAARAIAAMRTASGTGAGEDTRFLPTLEETTAHLLEYLRPGDVVLVLSAGDADRVSAAVLAHLRHSEGTA